MQQNRALDECNITNMTISNSSGLIGAALHTRYLCCLVISLETFIICKLALLP